jgi:ABC-type glycerol-3-phosphate transport system substrate-binding protein
MLSKKKTIIVSIFLIVLCMSGCKKSEKTTSNITIDDKTITQKTTLEVYVASGKLTNYVTSVAELYNQETGANIDLKITNVASGTATVQMISPKLVTHEDMPDIVSISDSAASGVISKFQDAFYSASDFGFYDKFGKNFFEQKLSLLRNQTNNNTIIPWASDFTPAVSFYQPALFESVGVHFDTIKSWDEYIEVAKKIKEKTGVYGIALPEAGDQEFFIDLMAQQGMPLFDKAGNLNLGTEAINAAKVIKKMIDAGIVNFYGSQDAEKAFQESAMFVAGGWYATNMSLNFPDAAGKWRIAGMIPFTDNQSSFVPISGGSSFYVPKDAHHPDVAQQFLTFMMTNEKSLAIALKEGVAASNQKAYDTSAANNGFAYFGDQKYNQLIFDLNQNTAAMFLPPNYSDATSYITTAAYKYWSTESFSDSYLQEADNFANKYGIKINK